jgi:hypothetical protein
LEALEALTTKESTRGQGRSQPGDANERPAAGRRPTRRV